MQVHDNIHKFIPPKKHKKWYLLEYIIYFLLNPGPWNLRDNVQGSKIEEPKKTSYYWWKKSRTNWYQDQAEIIINLDTVDLSHWRKEPCYCSNTVDKLPIIYQDIFILSVHPNSQPPTWTLCSKTTEAFFVIHGHNSPTKKRQISSLGTGAGFKLPQLSGKNCGWYSPSVLLMMLYPPPSPTTSLVKRHSSLSKLRHQHCTVHQFVPPGNSENKVFTESFTDQGCKRFLWQIRENPLKTDALPKWCQDKGIHTIELLLLLHCVFFGAKGSTLIICANSSGWVRFCLNLRTTVSLASTEASLSVASFMTERTWLTGHLCVAGGCAELTSSTAVFLS